MMQERQRFISRSSHPKVLHLRWGRIQEMALKNPLTPLPRARSPLKPKVTYYGFLGEAWRLQTSWVAHNLGWAITSTPSCLGVQGSKRNKLEIRELDQNQVLKRWEWGSLARILALAWLSLKSPIGITQEWRKGSVSSVRGFGKSVGWKGMEGYLYLSTWKRAIGVRVTRRLRV